MPPKSQPPSQQPPGGGTGTREKFFYFYHPDHLGSTSYVTDQSGEVYQHLEYFPFGETWVDESPGNSTDRVPYRFTGKEFDEETGLYYFGARYYDPRTSLWTAMDPALGKYLPTTVAGDDKVSWVAPSLHNNWRTYPSAPGMGGTFEPKNMNLYGYVNSNPLIHVDPDGLAGVVVSFGGEAEVGVPLIGQAGGQVSQNVAFLVDTSKWSFSDPLNVNFSVVSFQVYGGTAALGLPKSNSEAKHPIEAVAKDGSGVIVGAFAGIGFNAGITNANTGEDFSPPSATSFANIGMGLDVGIQYSVAPENGTWTLLGNMSPMSYGFGLAVGVYQTNSQVQVLYTTDSQAKVESQPEPQPTQ